MAILRFRIYWEDDDTVYRDISLKHTQTFFEFHQAILKCFEFDNKHSATFFRSNDAWKQGREITLEKYDKSYVVEPLIMADVALGTEIKNPNQKFLYHYDFNKNWHFLIELIQVDKEQKSNIEYPVCVRSEGMAPSQYGTKGLVDKRLAEMEEKYDLKSNAMEDNFTDEGDEGGEDADVNEDNENVEEEL